jgi:hypothetical protein
LLAAVATLAGLAAILIAGGWVAFAHLGRTGAVLSRTGFPPPDRPGPVLLVPGYGGGTAGLDVLARQLRAAGRVATVVRPIGDGTGDLAAQARVLDRYVASALRGGVPSVDVVGFSAGGVVALLWNHDHDGPHKARRVVTLGAPFHGTELAATGAVLAPDACPTACQQLVPGSSLLTRLASGVPGDHPEWLSLWTVQDQTVTPPDSARLAGAINVPLQSVCPGLQVQHGGLPANPVVAGIVVRALGTAPLIAPAPEDCTSS